MVHLQQQRLKHSQACLPIYAKQGYYSHMTFTKMMESELTMTLSLIKQICMDGITLVFHALVCTSPAPSAISLARL